MAVYDLEVYMEMPPLSSFLLLVFITITENKLKQTGSWKYENDQAHQGKYEKGSTQGLEPWETLTNI